MSRPGPGTDVAIQSRRLFHAWKFLHALAARIRLHAPADNSSESRTSDHNDVRSPVFEGQFRLGNGRYCYPLTVTDNFRRMLLGCHALETTRAQDVRLCLEDVFTVFGLPRNLRRKLFHVLSSVVGSSGEEHERSRHQVLTPRNAACNPSLSMACPGFGHFEERLARCSSLPGRGGSHWKHRSADMDGHLRTQVVRIQLESSESPRRVCTNSRKFKGTMRPVP